jgi:hypothetical protein
MPSFEGPTGTFSQRKENGRFLDTWKRFLGCRFSKVVI